MPASFCGRCGAPRSAGDRFCSTCGGQYPSSTTERPIVLSESIESSDHSPADESTSAPEPQRQQLPTKWLDFWTYIHLPLEILVGVPIALSGAADPQELFGIILVEIPLVALAVSLILGLRRRRLWAWQLNWLLIVIDVFGAGVARAARANTEAPSDAFLAFLIYSAVQGVIWGAPNYAYFIKRRVLFSGDPLFRGGVRTAFACLVWPKVGEPIAAAKASRQGVYAAGFMTVVTLIAVCFYASGHPVAGIDYWSLVDASVSAAIAWGIYRVSRTASVLGVALWAIEQAASWTGQRPQSSAEFAGHVLVAAVLLVMFVNAIRGCFAFHKHTRTIETSASVPAHDTRWKIYSAILTSFVLGVVALRTYQSLVVPAPTSSPIRSSEDLTALVRRVRPAVVTIVAYDSKGGTIGQGSGFFISKKGEFLTNHHVLEGASSAQIKMSDGTTNPVIAILGDDADSDLTRAIAALDDDTPYLPLAHQRAEAGDRVVVIGSPLGLEETVSEGIVAAVPEERQDIGEIMPATLQITAAISEGSSGGPVLNVNGQVIGVAAAYLRKGENLNFAVPLERILTLKRIRPLSVRVWANPRHKRDERDSFAEGLASMKLDDCDQGLRSFVSAVEHTPSFALGWWGIGVCSLEKGDKEDAVTALKRASQLDPSLSVPHYTLGLAYVAEGKKAKAQAEYEALKSMDPDLARKLAAEISPMN